MLKYLTYFVSVQKVQDRPYIFRLIQLSTVMLVALYYAGFILFSEVGIRVRLEVLVNSNFSFLFINYCLTPIIGLCEIKAPRNSLLPQSQNVITTYVSVVTVIGVSCQFKTLTASGFSGLVRETPGWN
jgi:hypothetical protein